MLDVNRPIGQLDSAHSLSVVLASDYSLTVSSTNPSIGTTGSAVPASATLVAGKNNAGNLTALALTAAGNLLVDGSSVTQPISAASLPLPSGAATAANQTTLSGQLPATLGTHLTAASLAVNIASDQTVPVSAASLPLPTGASTSAKQPALGIAGTASTDVLTVQGIASMTALKVDGSAVTQPVSAASLPLPTGAATSALQTTLSGQFPASLGAKLTAASLAVNIASDQTVPVSAASLPLPAGAATSALQTSGNASLTTIATNTPAVGQALMAASSPVVIASNQSAIPVTGTFFQGTQPVSGTVTANAGTGTMAVSLSTVNAAAGRASVTTVLNAYATTNVTSAAYVQLVASTSATINRLYISDTSGAGFYIATGAAASEVNQLLVGPGGSDSPYELTIASGTRISIKCADASTTMSSGTLYMTCLA